MGDFAFVVSEDKMESYQIPVKEPGAPDTDAIPFVKPPAALPSEAMYDLMLSVSRALRPETAPLAVIFSTSNGKNTLTYGTGRNDHVRYMHGNVLFKEILTHLPDVQAYSIAPNSPTARRRLMQEVRSLGRTPANLKAMTLEGRVFLF